MYRFRDFIVLPRDKGTEVGRTSTFQHVVAFCNDNDNNIKVSIRFKTVSEMASLGMALTLVRGPG